MPVRPFGMPYTPYNPETGEFLKLSPEAVAAPEKWFAVDSDSWTATPLSTSRLTMSDTSLLSKGLPIRYTIGDTYYYGVVDDISDDVYIDVRGAPLSGDLTALDYADSLRAVQMDFFIAGATLDSTSADLLASVMLTAVRWDLGTAYLVGFSGELETADGTADPKVNIEVDGDKVSDNDSSNGIQPTDSRIENPLVAIAVANYKVEYKDTIELPCTVAATDGDASDLTVSCLFVME